MAFIAKQSAQAHYDAGTQIMMNLHQASYIDSVLEGASTRVDKGKGIGNALSPIFKDLDQAIKHLQKAVIFDPNFADAFHNLAHAWYQSAEYYIVADRLRGYRAHSQEAEDNVTGALNSALDAVDKALAICYEFPQAHNTRAMILAKLFRLNEAMEAAELALSQYPDYQNASDNREKIKGLIRKRAAIPGYKDESSFLEDIKEAIKAQSEVWKDLMK